MNSEIRTAIEAHYGLTLQKCVSAPRQFVAETYILTDTQGRHCFCKCVDKPLFIPDIIKSLPVVEAMFAQGMDWIGYPIRAAGTLHMFVGDTLVVLFNYIPAPQSYEYSEYVLGRRLGQIHSATSNVIADIPLEDFRFAYRSEFDRRFEVTLMAEPDAEPVVRSLQAVLRKHEAEICHYLAEYSRLSELCEAEACEMVITHGDAPGNVLVKSFEDIYLVDWDEVLLAPAERDTWIMDHFSRFIDGYRHSRPGYVVNTNMRSFYIYKYYFSSMMHYFSEILGAFESEYRLSHVRDLEGNLLTGWMLPKLKSSR